MKRFPSRTVCGVCSIFVLVALGCKHDDLLMPATPPTPLVRRGVTLVEITIRDIGKPTMRAEALVGRSLAELNARRAERALRGPSDWKATLDLTVPAQSDGALGDATIQLRLIPSGVGAFTVNGQRYFEATFGVRNAQKTDSATFDTPRHNLTFIPVSTTSPATLLDSPVLVWNKLNGDQADPPLVHELKPTGLAATDAAGHVIGFGPDVLQVLTEGEVAAADLPDGVTNIFPYGFMTKVAENPASPRVLPPSPSATEFDGVMTVAFRLPVQTDPDDDPTTISLMMLALDDSDTRVTQSLEEQDPAAAAAVQTRATAIGADVVRVLPGHPGTFTPVTEHICAVRTTGPATAPTAFLVRASAFQSLNPSPYTGAGSHIVENSLIQAAFAAPVQGVSVSSANFVVRGLQSGQAFRGATYTTAGNTVTTPAGAFLAGEEVEVVLTSGLACPTPWVGRLRVAVPTSSSGNLAATPAPPTGLSVPSGVAVGDFDGNGTLDLAIANAGTNSVTIEAGDGHGGFVQTHAYSQGLSEPVAIAVADFNGDGHLDFAVASASGDVISVFPGRGDGSFDDTHVQTLAAGTRPEDVAVGDVNGDGALDIIVPNGGSDNVSVFLGSGDGTFQPQHIVLTAAEQPTRIAIGDVDRDGILDFVINSLNNSEVLVFHGNGNGTFAPKFSSDEPSVVAGIALGDVDGDGILDLVATGSVMHGHGDGTFDTPVVLPSGAGLPSGVAIADMNGDGRLDIVQDALVLTTPFSGLVAVFLNKVGGFERHDFATAVAPTGFLTIADLQKKGILDVLLPNNGTTLPIFVGQP